MPEAAQNTTQKDINLAEMSDDEINNLDYTSLNVDSDTESAQSATDDTETDNDAGETGGADPVDDSVDMDDGGADSTSTFEDTDEGNESSTEDQQSQAAEPHQGEAKQEVTSTDEKAQPKEVDPKEELARVFAPFKAAKREVKVDTVEDVRQLMQMGVDYARKMADMKPYMRVLKTLEKNNLLDEGKVNFLIDLEKKNPEAIRKFLKDSEIDPMDLSYEDDTNDYKPTNHIVGDKELQLDEVLSEIRDTEVFPRTVDTITKVWDKPSRQVLMDNPGVIRIINDHMASGIYDQVTAVMEKERMLGHLPPDLSDLDAYKAVGDAMHEAGAFKPNATSATGKTGQDFSQDSGSGSAHADKLRNRKKAASPTKGTAGTGKPKVDLGKLTDEQIENLDLATLL